MLPVVSATEVFEALPRNTNPDPLPLTNTFENGDTAEIKKWLTPRLSRMAKAVVGDACWIVDVMKAGAFTPPNADKSSASAGANPQDAPGFPTVSVTEFTCFRRPIAVPVTI